MWYSILDELTGQPTRNHHRMILQSATSGRMYSLAVRNTGGMFLSRVAATPSDVTSFADRCLVTEARTHAFSFEVTDADLNNPLVVLRQREVLQGRAYTLLSSPNGREWEVTCPQDGVYRVHAISTDWPKAAAPILSDSTGLGWRFEVDDAGVYSVTSDPAEYVRRIARLKTQDGTKAFQITVNDFGVLLVTDDDYVLDELGRPIPTEADTDQTDFILTEQGLVADDARYYEAELVSPNGIRWLLRVDNTGTVFVDSEWQDSLDNGDEWPLLIADRQGTLYCVDTRFPPPIGGGFNTGRPTLRRPW